MTVNQLSKELRYCAKQNEFPEILDTILTFLDESPLTKENEQLNINNIQPGPSWEFNMVGREMNKP